MASHEDDAPNKLLLLPTEVLLQVIAWLPAQDILACAATCKYIHTLIDDSSHLQLIIELAICGLRLRYFPAKAHHLQSAADQRQELLKSRNAWKRIEPVRTARFDLSKCMYEITEGLFGHGVLDKLERCRTLEFRRLWVDEEKKTCEEWKKYHDVGINLADFSFDLAEDLLVLVEAPEPPRRYAKRVFLRTLSENIPHPRAERAVLDSPGNEDWSECDIKVCGNTLVVQFDAFSAAETLGRLTIWDWTTGTMIKTCSNVGGYAFLSPTTLLTVIRRTYDESFDEIIPYYTFHIELYRLDDSSPHVVNLYLPLTSALHRPLVYSARPPRDSPNIPPELRFSPFINDETAERVIVIQILWDDTIFISARAVLRLLDQSIARPTIPGLSTWYNWSQWGPDATFWIAAPFLFSGFTCIDGSRFACLTQYQSLFKMDEEGNILRHQIDRAPATDHDINILILDFNPRPIIHEKKTINQEWMVDSDRTNQEIVCRLPFRAFQRPAHRFHHDLVIGPDHLVAITNPVEYEVIQFSD